MTTAPAAEPTTTEPERRRTSLNRAQKTLVGVNVTGAIVIAAIGFSGSYTAVRDLAKQKGFGAFAPYFPIGIDAGIVVLLGLDLLLTWLRIPFPLLRQTAWLLTAATIAFNGAAAWPDPLGVGMHASIPVLFIIAVEAARHAIGRIADLTAGTHYETPPLSRWLLAFPSSFRLYRWMRTTGIHTYAEALARRQAIDAYTAGLRNEHGRFWRFHATSDELHILRLARGGMPMPEAIRHPATERNERKQADLDAQLAAEQAERQRQKQRNALDQEEQEEKDAERRRAEETARQQRLAEKREDAERHSIAEAKRTTTLREETERRRIAEAAERERRLADAEEKARLAEINAKGADLEDEAHRREIARLNELAAAQREAEKAARDRQHAEAEAGEEAARTIRALQRLAELKAAANQQPASPGANGRHHAANPAANAKLPANADATTGHGTASASQGAANSSGGTANPHATGSQPPGASDRLSANGHNPGANSDADQHATVAAAYQLFTERHGRTPSDKELGEELGVGRSRAQQLRTAAANEGGYRHLAKHPQPA